MKTPKLPRNRKRVDGRLKRERLSDTDKMFYGGFAAALSTLAGTFGQPSVAAAVARANGVTLTHLYDAGVARIDLELFMVELASREARRTAPSRKKRRRK